MAVIPRMRRGSDGPGEAQQLRHIVGHGKDFLCSQSIQALVQDPCEAARCGRLLRSFEEEPVGAGAPSGFFSDSMVRNNGDWHSTTCSSSSGGWSFKRSGSSGNPPSRIRAGVAGGQAPSVPGSHRRFPPGRWAKCSYSSLPAYAQQRSMHLVWPNTTDALFPALVLTGPLVADEGRRNGTALGALDDGNPHSVAPLGPGAS